MSYTFEIDLRTIFKKFHCSKCGTQMEKKKLKGNLGKEDKERHYRELYPTGIPVKTEVTSVSWYFECPSCHHRTPTDEQVKIRKEQKKKKTKIL